MKKIKLTTFLLLCFFVASIAISWRFFTKGFRVHKIYSKELLKDSTPLNSQFINSRIMNSQIMNLRIINPQILDQKFKYFSKGSQTYVFISEDKKYVLKFLALNKYEEPFRRKLFGFLKSYRKKRKANRFRNFKSAIKSYKLAFENLKEETGILYTHFERTDLNKKVTLIDNLGSSYKIDLNSTFFIIQKKADLLKPKIKKLSKKELLKKDEMKKILKDYIDLSYKVVKKGIINRDSSFKNSGYIENSFVEIDLGRFFKIENSNKKTFFKNLEKYHFIYRRFLKKNYPDLLVFFDEEVEKLKKEY
jgi:hypothetical protein